jgi:UDP-GlcNAc:undecaprenyl-phosphate GlcNAc-1-phosphate transferase
MSNPALVFLLALAISLFATPQAAKLATRLGIVARPVARSMHSVPKPFGGGVAMYIAFALAALPAVDLSQPEVVGLLVCGGLVMLLGVWDDKVALRARVKFSGQIVLTLLMVVGFNLKWQGMVNPFTGQYLFFPEWLAIGLTSFWILAFMNVINLADGLDGLAGGIATIGAFMLMLMAMLQHAPQVVLLAAALAGAIIGFLRYNFHPSRIFMGDAGSMFLGFALATLSIQGVVKSAVTIGVAAPILLFALPIFDTAFAIVRRLASGRSIGEADKDHLHHRLLQMGLSHRNTVLVMWAVTGGLGLAALAVTEVPTRVALMILALVAAFVLMGARRLGLLRLRSATETAPSDQPKLEPERKRA